MSEVYSIFRDRNLLNMQYITYYMYSLSVIHPLIYFSFRSCPLAVPVPGSKPLMFPVLPETAIYYAYASCQCQLSMDLSQYAIDTIEYQLLIAQLIIFLLQGDNDDEEESVVRSDRRRTLPLFALQKVC